MRATKNTLELLRLQHRLEQHRLEEDVAAMATAVFAVYYDIVDCKHGFLDRALNSAPWRRASHSRLWCWERGVVFLTRPVSAAGRALFCFSTTRRDLAAEFSTALVACLWMATKRQEHRHGKEEEVAQEEGQLRGAQT